jgi:hypothetical protein
MMTIEGYKVNSKYRVTRMGGLTLFDAETAENIKLVKGDEILVTECLYGDSFRATVLTGKNKGQVVLVGPTFYKLLDEVTECM